MTQALVRAVGKFWPMEWVWLFSDAPGPDVSQSPPQQVGAETAGQCPAHPGGDTWTDGQLLGCWAGPGVEQPPVPKLQRKPLFALL